jgi:signal transduction histidine kinase
MDAGDTRGAGAWGGRPALGVLKTWAVVLSLCLVSVAIGVQYFVFDRLLRPAASSAATAVLLVAGVAGFSFAIWGRLERLQFRLRDAHAAESAQRRQARALAAASVDIATELDIDVVAQKIVDRSREVTGARYGALGVLDGAGRVTAFYASGIDPETRARLGPPPQGHGLLGLVTTERRTLTVDDIAGHPDAAGFPPGHPPMRTLLATPVWLRDEVIGNLYVADREDGRPFGHEDAEALERFAAQAAVAIQNARLHRRLQHLSIVAERERIAMDLHDGVIQSLFGVRLQLEAAASGLEEGHPLAEPLGDAITRVGRIMGDIRHYIFDLRAEQAAEGGLVALLRDLVASMRALPVFSTALKVEGTPAEIPRAVQWELWHICREALANAVRHSGGHRIEVTVGFGAGEVAVEIADDGAGWTGEPTGPGHHGLENMRRRAEAVGGALRIEGRPGHGTRVRATVPLDGAAGR